MQTKSWPSLARQYNHWGEIVAGWAKSGVNHYMFENKQKTLTKAINFVGTGLHLGKKASINLEPAEADTGIIFKRTDIKNNNEIKANYTNVSSAKLCTKIENDHGISVSTIEHLMAALYICGVDNLVIKIDGEEVPIMDLSLIHI